jgi:molybdate transport system substrate-binding protein
VKALALIAPAVVLAACSTPAPLAGTPPPGALQGTVTVLAAASLTEAFDALAASFESEHPGVDVVLGYGGSSALATQIIQGAPADVFAAADEATMQSVVEAGHAQRPTIFTTNTLEIAVPAGNPARVTGLADLAEEDPAIALCDPHVPCGSAAQTLLDSAGIVAKPDTLEQDVRAVLTKIELGEADAGLVYITDVVAAGDAVEGIEVPEAAEVVNRYPIAVLSESPNAKAAHAWVEYVLSPDGRRMLAAAGFVAP